MEHVCGIQPTKMTEILSSQSVNHNLIIDCRSFLSYNVAKVIDSVNIHCPPILKRRSGGFIPLENIVPCENKRSLLVSGLVSDVLVYDDNTEDLTQVPKDSNLLSVIKSLLQQIDNLTIRYVIGGFEAVRKHCPAGCVEQATPTHPFRERAGGRDHNTRSNCYNNAMSSTPSVREPAKILPYLYLGDESHSSQRSVLDRLGITALVNVSSSCPNHFGGSYRYMNIHIADSMGADLYSWFPAVNKFIDEVAANNGKVLVHCLAGISRSATACIAYIMEKQHLSLEKAFDFILALRPIIDPNLNFIQQLQRYEPLCLQKQFPSMSHIPPPSPRPCTAASVFSFSPVSPKPSLTSSSNALSRMSNVPYLSQTSRSRSDITSSSSSGMQELSPSSLSQTAASPNPMRAAPSRPKSLPLPLHLNASLPPYHRCSISPTNSLTLPQADAYMSQTQKLSPMFQFTLDPEDEVAVAIPVSQVPDFDAFPRESSCPPLHSPQKQHTTASTSYEVTPSLNSYHLSATDKSSFPSPLSPRSVTLSPVSPVPSFG